LTRVLFKTVSGSKEDRRLASSHRPVSSHQVQGGHCRISKTFYTTQYVDHVHRPEGYILSHPNPSRIVEVSTLPGAGKGIPVPSFILQAKYGPKVI
jgi:hypothetical protein